MNIFWFRRDLRLKDNAGLYHALKQGETVLPIFIFDRHILDKLEERQDRRVQFIHQELSRLRQELRALGSDLSVFYGLPLEVFKELSEKYSLKGIFANHDYESYARERDQQIAAFCHSKSITFQTYKDQCIFEKDEVLTGQNTPYTVFTPYSKKWKATLNDFYLKPYPNEKYFQHFCQYQADNMPSLEAMDFAKVANFTPPQSELPEAIVKRYSEARDYPAQRGTTRLSVHLRFGTLSIRYLVKRALELNETWLNELIWRDFYMMILHHFPHVETQSFRPKYEQIPWRNNADEFVAWCEGRTGYPLVDAGMRELNATGFMHNRVRMVTASFLVKHLLIDWRWGERYFAQKLLDYDLSANNGGWQWAAGSGCDAAPYFRVFNPSAQAKKFDPEGRYIKQWVKEFDTLNYARPIVEHKFARERALKTYKEALN